MPPFKKNKHIISLKAVAWRDGRPPGTTAS